MKNFILFAGDDYYPEGGAYDFKGAFKTLEEAIEFHDPNEYNNCGGWANIFDLENEEIVKKFSRGTWCEGHIDIDLIN